MGERAAVLEERATAAATAAARLRSRAAYLRQRAAATAPLVGVAYRRRAAELELHAWLIDVRTGAVGPPAAA